MAKQQKLGNRKFRIFFPSLRIKERCSRLKKRISDYLLSFDIIHWFVFKKRNKAEFKKIAYKNASDSVDILIEGLGGIKNLSAVKKTINSLEIVFKSKYLVRKDILSKCNGLGIDISDYKLFVVFGKEETRKIASSLKAKISEAKSKYIEADIE